MSQIYFCALQEDITHYGDRKLPLIQIAKSGGYKIVDNWWSHYTCKWDIHQLSAISYPPLLAICTGMYKVDQLFYVYGMFASHVCDIDSLYTLHPLIHSCDKQWGLHHYSKHSMHRS